MSPDVAETRGNGRTTRWRDRVAAVGRRAGQRVRSDAWPLVQRTAAATIAWLLALLIGDHPDPFFAPIAAVVALNAAFGERGLNALRLLSGVIVGILAGEIALLLMGGGSGSLAVATFAAMTIARGLGGAPLVVAQAASAAILTIAAADGQVGPDRMVDAVIGAGVALVFSQLLFTPEPVRLLRRAESAALSGMAEGLRLTAHALDDPDERDGEQAIRRLRDLPEQLLVLKTARGVSGRIARHSLVGRARIAPVAHEQESADHLGLLGVSCLMLARTALATGQGDRGTLSSAVNQVAELLTELASSPGDATARQAVVDRVPALLQDFSTSEDVPDSSPVALEVAFRVVVADLMVFAGVDAEESIRTVSEGATRLRMPPPAPTAKLPWMSKALAGLLPWNWRVKRKRRT